MIGTFTFDVHHFSFINTQNKKTHDKASAIIRDYIDKSNILNQLSAQARSRQL